MLDKGTHTSITPLIITGGESLFIQQKANLSRQNFQFPRTRGIILKKLHLITLSRKLGKNAVEIELFPCYTGGSISAAGSISTEGSFSTAVTLKIVLLLYITYIIFLR